MGMSPLSPAQRELYERATSAYRQQYQEDEQAQEYLEVERGLDWSTIARLRLGVVREPINDDHRQFINRIHVPNIGGSGHVVTSKFRIMEFNGEPVPGTKCLDKKYHQSFGQIQRLFNLQALTYADTTIYVTEGEMDAICVEDVGLPAVGVPGANMMAGAHGYRRRIFEGLEVVLCKDNDENEAGDKLVKAMSEYTDRVVSFAPHGDLNDFYKANGADALIARLKGTDSVRG